MSSRNSRSVLWVWLTLFALLAGWLAMPGDAQKKTSRPKTSLTPAQKKPTSAANKKKPVPAKAEEQVAQAEKPKERLFVLGQEKRAALRDSQTANDDTADEGERDTPRERERYFYEQRAYPNKEIPFGARLRALERVREMRRQEQEWPQGRTRVEAFIGANPNTWTPIGPRPTNSRSFGFTSGRTPAMAVDLTNPDIVYAGGAQAGVWKSIDGGVNWAPLTDNQPTLSIGSIAIDPSSCTPGPCATIYVGTGEQTFSGASYYGAGLLKSTDGGATWTHLPGTISPPVNSGTTQITSFVGPFSTGFSPGGGARIGSLAVSNDGSVILAGVQIFVSVDGGSSSGIFRSTDGGVTWTQVLAGAVGTEVFFDPDNPNNPNVAWAALGSPNNDSDNGIYRSATSGLTWQRIAGPTTTNWPTTNLGRIELAIAPSNSQVLYVGIANSSDFSLNAFLRSANGGATWTNLTANAGNYCNAQCDYDHVVIVHPNNSDVVFVGGAASNYLRRSTDGGLTFSDIFIISSTERVHVDIQSMAFGMSGAQAVRLYVGNDGGVWSADVSVPTNPITFVNRNSGLEMAQFYPGLSIHPSDEQMGVGGTQDNGTQFFRGQLEWIESTCGDGGYTVIEPTVPSTVYATCQIIAIRRSLRNGDRNTFTTGLTRGINLSDPVAFIPPFVNDPGTPNRLYFGTNKLYQSNDGADNWTAMGTLPNVTGTLRSIAVAPTDPNTVYVGTSTGKIYRTRNANAGAGTTWFELTAALSSGQFPTRVVTSISVHPADPLTIFVTNSGFSGSGPNFSDQLGHVFRGTFSAADPPTNQSWSDISGAGAGALPNTPVNSLVVDPTPASGPVGDTLYIGTDVGVFATNDGGQNWATLMSGLPNVTVTGLKLRQQSRTLRAGTHGRGMWDLQLSGLPAYALTGVSPPTADLNQAGFPLEVRGQGFTPNSVVQWNGAPLATTPIDDKSMTAMVTSAELATAGLVQITVNDPGNGTTNALTFTVLNTLPTLISISPTGSSVTATPPVTITANGANFDTNTRLNFGGVLLNTTLVNSTQITADLTANELVGGVFAVRVRNLPPGGGDSAALTFRIDAPAPINDNFAAAVTVALDSNGNFSDAQNNVGATVEVNDPAAPSSCTSGASQSGRANSIWYRFAPTASGAVTVNTQGSAYDTILIAVTGSPGAFVVVACDDDALGTAGPSEVLFSVSGGTTYFFMISAWDGTGGATAFNLSFSGPPPNDDIGNAEVISGGGFTHQTNSASATVQTTDPSTSTCAPGSAQLGRAKSIWYRYVAGGSGTFDVNTFGSAYDTILAAYRGNPGTLTEAACNDDTNGLQSSISFQVNSGETIHLMVSAYFDDGGATTLTVVSAPAALPDYGVSSAQPTVTVNRGQSAQLNLTVTPFGGAFTGTVTFSCSGLPSLSSCSFNPASMTPGSTPQTVVVTISTTAPSFVAPQISPPLSPRIWPRMWVAALAMLFLLAAMMRLRRARWARALGLFAAVVLLASCGGGGGGGSSGGGTPSNPGTPTGQFVVTVNANSSGTVRVATFTLRVQ